MRIQHERLVNFNYLPPKIKFGAFRLKLANKMQESPDRHRRQWVYRLNCIDTIYVNRHQIRTGVPIAPDYMCFESSWESSHGDSSFDYPQHVIYVAR